MPAARARPLSSGFTLVELLVVLVIIGITLGLATLNALPSQRQQLEQEARRLALLLQLARDEAIVRNRLVAFEADNAQYRFLVRGERGWEPVTRDDLLRERRFKNAPLQLTLEPRGTSAPGALRITFGREPVDKPFILRLGTGDDAVAIRADGIGHFTVE